MMFASFSEFRIGIDPFRGYDLRILVLTTAMAAH